MTQKEDTPKGEEEHEHKTMMSMMAAWSLSTDVVDHVLVLFLWATWIDVNSKGYDNLTSLLHRHIANHRHKCPRRNDPEDTRTIISNDKRPAHHQ